jgi:hypothetical protein
LLASLWRAIFKLTVCPVGLAQLVMGNGEVCYTHIKPFPASRPISISASRSSWSHQFLNFKGFQKHQAAPTLRGLSGQQKIQLIFRSGACLLG